MTQKKQKNAEAKKSSKKQKTSEFQTLKTRIMKRIRAFMARRPHRTFKRTYRRDYKRSLALPGYWSFTASTLSLIKAHKAAFLWMGATYGILVAVFLSIGSQELYSQLSEALRNTSNQIFSSGDGVKPIEEAALLLFSAVTGGYRADMTPVQQVYAATFGLLIWLTTIWLVRSALAGGKPKFRDGLYNAGAPIVPTFLVSIVALVQLIPAAIAVLFMSSASQSGVFSDGVEAMLFWSGAVLFILLSLYWLVATFFALIIVTLPGMYPLRALRSAGDIVTGRRVRILLRMLWMLGVVIATLVVTMIPIIILDAWIKGFFEAIQWIPIVPVSFLLVSTITLVWSGVYIYMLYRKVVDDDAAPA